MQTSQKKPQEVWIKILSKGIVTIPKSFREQLGIREGDVAKARIEGNQLIIESREKSHLRTYTKKEIEEMIKDDQLPKDLAEKTKEYWSDLP